MNQSQWQAGRTSQRKQIFSSTHRSDRENQGQTSQSDDIHRIAGRIRSLEDDLRAVLGDNDQLEEENRELLSLLQQLQYLVARQDAQIQALSETIEKESNVGTTIEQYEADLRAVGEQISLLQGLILDKNEHYSKLKNAREEAERRQAKLKEQANLLAFQNNALHQQLDETAPPQQMPSSPEPLITKLDRLLELINAANEELTSRQSAAEQSKRQIAQTLMREKERRIKLEFNVRLLRERRSDFEKKKQFLQHCYNQQGVQQVIDDMLLKEDALRRDIHEQVTRNTELQQEMISRQAQLQKQQQREKNRYQQEIHVLKMQGEMAQAESGNCRYRLSQVEEQLTMIEGEGQNHIEKYMEELEDETMQRVRKIEQENKLLQQRQSELAGQVAFLTRQMAS